MENGVKAHPYILKMFDKEKDQAALWVDLLLSLCMSVLLEIELDSICNIVWAANLNGLFRVLLVQCYAGVNNWKKISCKRPTTETMDIKIDNS